MLDLARLKGGPYKGAWNDDLDLTFQEAREEAILAFPEPAPPPGGKYIHGPIYFYAGPDDADFLVVRLCNDADDPEVNLLQNLKTHGNKYFYPVGDPSGLDEDDPNRWTLKRVKDAYDADRGDSLRWFAED